MGKLKIIWFWIVSFSIIIWNTIKGNNWNMIYVDFHFGDDKNNIPIRKQLIAKKTYNGLEIYWQDLSKYRMDNLGDNHESRN